MFGPGWVRFILSWMVVVEHVSRFAIGKVAVMAFFILSGYWVTRMFIERYAVTPRGVPIFYLSRFLRIWPLYMVVFLSLLLTAVVLPLDLSPNLWWALPILGVASHGVDIIGVTWSLDIELQFYLLLPVIVLGLRSVQTGQTTPFLLLGAGLLWALGLLLGWRYGILTALAYLPLFLAGGALFIFDMTAGKPAARISVGLFILVGLVSTAIPELRPFVIYGSGNDFTDQIFALFWGLVLVPFLAFNIRQPSTRTDAQLGTMSYVIYLVHFPIIHLADVLLGRDMTDPEKLFYFAVVFLVSWLIQVGLDMHLERWRKAVVDAALDHVPVLIFKTTRR